MNKNGRLYRSLRAFKHAFMEDVNVSQKKQSPKSIANNTSKNEPITNDLLTIIENPKTIADLKHEYCCGCGACANVCPVNAINMTFDNEGYLKPIIDFQKCVDCGKCKNTCPVINTQYKNNSNPKCYAVMSDDETRRKSSSGGMFSIVANHVFQKGGYVCGAYLTDRFNVEFLITDNPNDLDKMRGSKYVQANTKDTFSKIKKLLDDNKLVLFSATPCQVAGLYGFLGSKTYDNLITLDILCHGTPSQSVFDKYIEDYFGKNNLSDFKFRTKELGYSCINQVAYLKDGSKYIGNIKFDPYEKVMHSGLTLKKVCTDCPFAEAPRQGDISIGDFWGISQYKKELNDGLGTSNAVINNKKGENLFNELKSSMKLCEEVPFDFARKHNRFGRHMKTPNGRRWYFTMAKGQSFEKSVNYALNRKFDVGIIGLWYGRNYGSMATYYALHQVLTNVLHLSVLMIKNPLDNNAPITKTDPKRIANEFYDVSLKYNISDLGILNTHCDTFMVGSDQLWNIYLSRPYQQMYYLSFASEYNKKIAYGTSFGIKFAGSKEERVINSHYLKQFDHISVRDNLSEQICVEQFGISKDDVTQVCDPTFLCPIEEYQKLMDRAENTENGEYILAYILDPNEQIGKQLEELSIEKKSKIVVLIDENPKAREKNMNSFNFKNNLANIEIKKDVDLYEWIWFYNHAKSVVTDSFHGTIFSIIFEKPFISLINVNRGAERFISLLTPLGLNNRLFDNPNAIGENSSLLNGLDYTEPNKELNKIREKSMNWLKNALFSTKKLKSKSIFNVQDAELEENKNV